MREKIVLFYKNHREILLYLFFGGSTTFVNWFVYALAVECAGFSINTGNVIAWIAAVIFAFITNKIFVFQSREWRLRTIFREAGSFLGARIISGLVELAGVPLLFALGLDYPLFGIRGFAAKLLVSVVIIVLNYIFSKLFVFKNRN